LTVGPEKILGERKNWAFKGKLANTSKLVQVYTILAGLTELTRCKIIFSLRLPKKRVYILFNAFSIPKNVKSNDFTSLNAILTTMNVSKCLVHVEIITNILCGFLDSVFGLNTD
jgi:hypothetical protein